MSKFTKIFGIRFKKADTTESIKETVGHTIVVLAVVYTLFFILIRVV